MDKIKVKYGVCSCGVVDEDSKDDNDIMDCTGECPRYMPKTVAVDCGCGMPNTDSDKDQCWTTTMVVHMTLLRNLPAARLSNKNECKIKMKPFEHQKNGLKCNQKCNQK